MHPNSQFTDKLPIGAEEGQAEEFEIHEGVEIQIKRVVSSKEEQTKEDHVVEIATTCLHITLCPNKRERLDAGWCSPFLKRLIKIPPVENLDQRFEFYDRSGLELNGVLFDLSSMASHIHASAIPVLLSYSQFRDSALSSPVVTGPSLFATIPQVEGKPDSHTARFRMLDQSPEFNSWRRNSPEECRVEIQIGSGGVHIQLIVDGIYIKAADFRITAEIEF
ncbi:hypothetical protein C8R43DRAFT_947374 [Mycena crocata]|nr:hypothetical protein C8R43DRAFT_947374 [Mycena crocata]